ncbi:MAG: HNH endonuclease signature motif containing protein [Candidatus ainarchaeum sp.]|nr:HNH endonuclease signature motif containing protein [Candidatus ainarchaeum sp.]
MSFDETTIKLAWDRADGKCEKCKKQLLWESRGKESEYGWEAHHIKAVSDGGSDKLENCKILCQECHKRTHSFGNH